MRTKKVLGNVNKSAVKGGKKRKTGKNALEILKIVGKADDGKVSAELVTLMGLSPTDVKVITALLAEGIVIDPTPVVIDHTNSNLTMGEEYVLLLRMQKAPLDSSYVALLWEHYGKFVDSIVKGLSINNDEDWFRNLGREFLYEASLKHDIMTGNRFTSYAKRTVRGLLLKVLNKNYLIYIPEDVQVDLAKLMQYIGRNVGLETVEMLKYNWTEDELKAMESKLKFPREYLEWLFTLLPLRAVVSLEPPSENSEGSGMWMEDKGNDLVDDSPDPEESYLAKYDRESLWNRIKDLPQEQRIAVAYYTGYIDGQEWTIRAIAKKMTEIMERKVTEQEVTDLIKDGGKDLLDD